MSKFVCDTGYMSMLATQIQFRQFEYLRCEKCRFGVCEVAVRPGPPQQEQLSAKSQ